VPQTPEEEDYQINLALRESQQTTRIQNDQLSFVNTSSISGAPDFRFSHDYNAVNSPCHKRRGTHTSTNIASEENALSLLPYGQSDQLDRLSFSHARSISRARAHDFKFTQDCAAVKVPSQGPGSTDASPNNASEENALSLLASAANLLSDNSAE